METEKRPIDANRHERVMRRFAELLELAGKMEGAEAVKTLIKGMKLEPTLNETQKQGKKIYDPEELVVIPLTREQWNKVTNSLKNDADAFYNRSLWGWQGYVDPKCGQEIADKYKKESQILDELRNSIEKILVEPWMKKETEDEY